MSSIIVALITTAGVIITSVITNKTNKKIESLDSIKAGFKEEIGNIRKELNETRKEHDKTYLTDFLSDLENGQTKSDIQIKRAYEVYEEYSSLNGNSYVHDKWEELVKEGVL